MADRYLLESGAPDGYLLEDGSGVLLLEDPPMGGGVLKEEARIHRWAVDESIPQFAAPSPLQVTDDSSWWTAMLFGAAAAIAIAAAPIAARAHAVASLPQVEIVPAAAPAPILDSGEWSPPILVPAPRSLGPFVADDPLPARFPADDLSGPKLESRPESLQVVVWATNEEIVPQPAPSSIWDGAEWPLPTPLRVPVQAPLFPDADSFPQVVPSLDEGWWAPPAPAAVPAQPLLFWPDDSLPVEAPPAPTLEEGLWPAELQRALPIQPAPQPFAEDDLPVPTAPAEEAYWLQLPWIVPEPVVRVWTFQDEAPPPPPPLPVDEAYLHLELRSYQPPPFVTLFEDPLEFGELFAPEPPVVQIDPDGVWDPRNTGSKWSERRKRKIIAEILERRDQTPVAAVVAALPAEADASALASIATTLASVAEDSTASTRVWLNRVRLVLERLRREAEEEEAVVVRLLLE